MAVFFYCKVICNEVITSLLSGASCLRGLSGCHTQRSRAAVCVTMFTYPVEPPGIGSSARQTWFEKYGAETSPLGSYFNHQRTVFESLLTV